MTATLMHKLAKHIYNAMAANQFEGKKLSHFAGTGPAKQVKQ